MARSPERLKSAIGSGLLSFPVTHFTDDGVFAPGPYRDHINYLAGYRPAVLFAAGGTGEFFSLQLAEYENVIAAAVEAAGGGLPVVAGVGYGTALAIEFAKLAEKAGADGILLLPHYLIQAEQEGLYRHIAAICGAVGIGVIVYHRDNCLFELDTMRRLADTCPNLIGFKDGHGNVEQLTCLRETLGDRLVYVGGMPTAEVFAAANRAIGVSTYSSAIFNFVPEYAQRFFAAIHSGDRGVCRAKRCGASSSPISPCGTSVAATRSASSRRACASLAGLRVRFAPLSWISLRIKRRRWLDWWRGR